MFLLWAGSGAALAGQPFKPSKADQSLEKLPVTPLDPTQRELKRLRNQLTSEPANLALACELARKYVEETRAEGDPRYLGYAQSALAPWWGLDAPPPEVRLLRATIWQSTHRFEDALAELDHLLAVDPKNGQALLTKFTILTVQGKYPEATRLAVPIYQCLPRVAAVTAAAQVAGLSGRGRESVALLRTTLNGDSTTPPAEMLWAWTLLGEMQQRLGDPTGAEQSFVKALSLNLRSPYLLGAYADFLLDENRPGDAVKLLESEGRVDGLLLRLALAEQKIPARSQSAASHISMLADRFAAAHARGDSVHQREEARFELHLRKNPAKALELALENWKVQREPADARLVLESAQASGHSERAEPVLAWLKKNGLEDVRLKPLAQTLTANPPSH